MNKVLVLFSGGLDSAYLLQHCIEILGNTNVRAVIGVSNSLAKKELDDARKFAKEISVELIEIKTDELFNESYVENKGDRCYFCKQELYKSISKFLKKYPEYLSWSIVDGLQASDNLDDRPGVVASREFGIIHPLYEANINKNNIVDYFDKQKHWLKDKPQMACLSSRLMPGTQVTESLLKIVEDAEIILHNHGFKNFRVRVHDISTNLTKNSYIARIEFCKLDEFWHYSNKSELIQGIKNLGFAFVTLDLEGYKTGGFANLVILKSKE